MGSGKYLKTVQNKYGLEYEHATHDIDIHNYIFGDFEQKLLKETTKYQKQLMVH